MKKFLGTVSAFVLTMLLVIGSYGAPSSGRSSSGSFSGGSRSSSPSSSSRSTPSSSPSRSFSSPSPSRSSSGSFSGSSSKPAVAPSRSSSGSFSSKPAAVAPTTAPSKSAWGSSVPKPVVSSGASKAKSVDNKVTSTVKSAGSKSSFTNKQVATDAFKAKVANQTGNGGQYTSHFDKEPSSRPNYIPTTTSVGGTNVNVVYNSGYGGYGYYHPSLGTWIAYDMIRDAAMLSMMASHHGYVVESPSGSVVYGFPSGFAIFLIVMIIGGFSLVIVFVLTNRK